MEIGRDAKLLRVFIGESDRAGQSSLSERIVREARLFGLAGATAWRGICGFGLSSRLRTERILDLSADLPIVLEIVDSPDRIDAFIPVLNGILESARCGGLVTVERVEAIRYTHEGRDGANEGKS